MEHCQEFNNYALACYGYWVDVLSRGDIRSVDAWNDPELMNSIINT